MAYTRNWDNTSPAGSAQISGGDNAIRAMKEDIDERLSSVFEDIDADPLVLKSTVVGSIGAGTKKMVISGGFFQPSADEDDTSYQGRSMVSDNSGDRQLFAPVLLPVGAMITEVEVLWDKRTLSGVQCTLRVVDFDTALGEADVVQIINTTAGVQLTPTGGMAPYEVLADTYLYIVTEPTTAGLLDADRYTLYGVRITYTVDSVAETL